MSDAPLWNNVLQAGENLSKNDRKVLVEILLCIGELRFLAISLETYIRPYKLYREGGISLKLDQWKTSNLEWVLTSLVIIRSYIKALKTLANKRHRLSLSSRKLLLEVLNEGETGILLRDRRDVEHNRHKLTQLIAVAVRDKEVEVIDQNLNITLVDSCKKVAISRNEMDHFISKLKTIVSEG